MNDSSAHPDARALERFLRGRLPADEAQRVGDHLAGCAACRRALAAIRAGEKTAPGDDGPGASEEPTQTPPPAAAEAYPFLAPPQAADELGRLGCYRVLRLLGEGGMGVVFEAEDLKLRRHVALKVMRPAGAGQEVFRERFLREARAAARLEHDHVVPVYQVDEDRGVLFLAMPLLRGETLDDRLVREPKPPLAEVLRVGREIAEGLEAAHAHGLIHRDVKPSNVWLEAGRGRVKLLDFGLARVQDDDDKQLTQEGLVMGTPAYMAPEQAQGRPLDFRCDLFSLGCILYRMTTGRNAFQGDNPFSLMVAVTTADPPPPADLEPNLPPALADLILDLLAKDPALRPASAREVADRIAAVEHARDATEAVPAVPPRRRRRGSLVALLLLLIGIGALAGAGWRYGPQIAAMFAGSKGDAPPPAGPPADKSSDPVTGLALAARPAALAGVRGWTVETRGGRGPFRDAACRPTGPVLATAGADGSVRLWDVETGALLRILLAHDSPMRAVAWSADGKALAALGAGGVVDVWNADDGRLLQTIRLPAPSRALAWSPDGARLAAGGEKRINLWEAQTAKSLHPLEGQVGETRALAWSPDGKTMAGVAADRVVRLWDVDRPKDPRSLPDDPGAEAAALAWSPEGKLLAVGRTDLTVQVWDLSGPDKLLKTLPAAAPDRDRLPAAVGLAWAPHGRMLAVIGPAGVQVWAAPFDKPPRRVEAPGTAVSWSADGRRLATCDEETGVRVWDASAARPAVVAALPVYKMERLRAEHWSPDGKLVALQGEQAVWIISTETGRLTQTLRGPTREITATAWSADGKRIAAAGGWDRQAYVWGVETGRLEKTYTAPHPDCEVTAVAWSPDGRTLAVGVDRPVETALWEVDGGKPATVLRGEHTAAINALLWTDAKTLVTGSADETAVVWNTETGKFRTLRPSNPGPPRPVTALALAPDGKSFAAGIGGTGPHAARLFGVASDQRFEDLRGAGVGIGQMTWLPDGKSMAGRGDDGVVRFWDIDSGQVTRKAPPPPGQEYFTPENGVGAAGSHAFSVRWWSGLDETRPETAIVLLDQAGSTRWLAVSADGHYAAAKELEPDLVYVVQTDAGMQTLAPKDFAAAYSWKNDPGRVAISAAK